jgi:hypothetical protein
MDWPKAAVIFITQTNEQDKLSVLLMQVAMGH